MNDTFLVDFTVGQALAGFQRGGIRGAVLSDKARPSLIACGVDPDDTDYEGTEIERTISNKDPLRKAVGGHHGAVNEGRRRAHLQDHHLRRV